MTITTALIVALGGFAGGFISGLSGFGLALVSLGLWLHVLEPIPAVITALCCSVASQLSTVRAVLHVMEPRRVLPFVLPGLLGIPLGQMALGAIPVDLFRLVMGVILITFSGALLLWRRPIGTDWGGRAADAMVGFLGGVLGGFAALLGSMPTFWAIVRGWGKDEKRSVFQAFNLAILGTSLAVAVLAGRFDRQLTLVVALAVPATLIGANLGVRTYQRLSDRSYNDAVLGLLVLTGLSLLIAV